MKFYANPYNASVSGFYFETYEEFELKLSDLKDDFGVPVEEVEIEAIDGTREEMELADVFGIDQANIAEFIAFIETSDEDLWPAIYFILNDNRASSFDEAIRIARDYSIRAAFNRYLKSLAVYPKLRGVALREVVLKSTTSVLLMGLNSDGQCSARYSLSLPDTVTRRSARALQ